ncbi:MAG: hypothetical protein OEU92_26860 [Alphaproteobacteria bacterium]|nr:hypothetical protein [Alphaproteobacteria bacterium]
MITAPPRAIALLGTDEPVASAKTLRAGPLTAEFDNGALRYIKIGGVEAIRNIAFVVRDENWGTYNPVLQNLKIGQASNAFEVSFDAVCKGANQELHYSARIKGNSDGSLVFEGVGKAITDFSTNRTGFVVLHPVDGVAGCPVEVTRVDGSTENTAFPELIDPMCPFQDLRALTHEVLPGVKVTCRMEGDAFETEDHRNWNDASFKTYVRPLAKPWPYTIKAGDVTEQSVTLTLEGNAPTVASGGGIEPVTLKLGAEIGAMPAIGLSLPPEQDRAILQAIEPVKKLAPQFFLCPFDSRIVDGAPKGLAGPRVSTFPLDDPRLGGRGEVMAMFKAMADATGAELVLEAVLACRDSSGEPSADEEIMRRDLELIRSAAEDVGVTFARVAVSPSSDLKCTLPGSVWPPCPEATVIYEAAREAFPGVPIGGGMFSFFTELNRKRPPVDAVDFVCHSSCPMVHASDDITAMENLEALPHIIKSTRAFAGDLPYRVGPGTIGARDNPYGAAATPNPQNGRLALARMDPRQRGLLGAAWNLGYVAHLARGGVEAVTLSAPVGEFGVTYAKMDFAQPWFDQRGEGVYPVYHVIRGLAAGAGKPMLATELSNGAAVQAVAYQDGASTTLWIANLTGEPQEVLIDGLPGNGQIATLDLDSFTTATAGPDALETTTGPVDQLDLGAYAVIKVVV